MSWGKTTVEKSDHAPRCQIRYGVPALTLGRLDPIWILWIRTFMSWVSWVSGLMVCGVWHMMQSSTLRRDPPWPMSGSWHWLQALVVTTERVTETAEPFGTNVNTSFEVSLHSSNVPNSARLRCAETPMEWVTVASKLAGALVLNVYV